MAIAEKMRIPRLKRMAKEALELVDYFTAQAVALKLEAIDNPEPTGQSWLKEYIIRNYSKDDTGD